MTAKDAADLVETLEQAGIDVWLDGGWGVDALFGEQTREHDDLDLLVRLEDVPALLEILAGRGYELVGGAAPMSFELVDDRGLKVDVHPVAFTEAGDGLYRMRSGEDWIYPAAGFAGTGEVGGRRMRCLTPEVQLLCHTGYELTADHLRDVAELRRRFG